MKDYNIVEVKYLPATNIRPSRVKLISARLDESVTIPFDYSLNTSADMAIAYLKSKKIKVLGKAWSRNNNDYLIIGAENYQFKSIK